MSYKRVLLTLFLMMATVALMGLTACRPAEGDANAAPPSQTERVSYEAAIVPIEVMDVQVEIGVGSPIPVYVQVAGTWPGLCAQLAAVEQQVDTWQFDITLLADVGDPDCPPDFMGLPFSLALPINAVELPQGSYTVTVNGISASFDVPLTP